MPPHVSLSSKSISGTKSDSMLSYSGYFLCYIVFIIGTFARNFHIGLTPTMNSLKIRDPSLTRLPTIGSFSLL